MKFKESIEINTKISIPPELKDHLTFLSTCKISPREEILFDYAFRLIALQIQSGDPIPPMVHLNWAVIDCDSLQLQFDSKAQYGCHISYVFFPIHKWRSVRLKDIAVLACIIEEFCHGLWIISDEMLVKQKVLAILNRDEKINVSFDDLYVVDDSDLPALKKNITVRFTLPSSPQSQSSNV